jgi:hypothetical protein
MKNNFKTYAKEINFNEDQDVLHYDSELTECLKNSEAIEARCGVKTSFGELLSRSGYLAEFATSQEDDSISEYGTHVDTIEYLQNLDGYEKKKVLAKSKNILETQLHLVEGLDQEIIDLYAEQLVDLEEFPFSYSGSGNVSSDITLQVRRLSKAGRWYNVGDKLIVDVEDLFDINQNVFTTRYINGKSAIELLMDLHGVSREHTYFVDGKKVSQEQMVVIGGEAFSAGVEIDGVRLHSTVTPFRYSYNSQDKKVVYSPTYFMDQNVVEFSSPNEEGDYRTLFAVIPSTDDESNGDAAVLEFNNGIQYGKNIANQAMMSDETTDAIIATDKSEASRADMEGKKARRSSLTKIDIAKINDESLLASEIGVIAKELITIADFNLFTKELESNKDRAEEILKAVEAHKRVFGKALKYNAWKHLSGIAKDQKDQKFSELVEPHIVENIANINNGSLSVDRLDNEDVVEIREASLKYGRIDGKRTACWIANKDVSNAIKTRYAQIKNVLV